MADLSQLTQDALSLPLDDRIQLAQRLWASLEPATDAGAEDQESDLLDLADRRDADLQTGSVKGVSHADALAMARKSLGCE